MKYSTGRGTKAKHSTAMEWDEYEKKKRRRSRVRHSTGRGAVVRHSCGVLLDEEASEQENSLSRDFVPVEKKKESKEKKSEKDFKKVVADY